MSKYDELFNAYEKSKENQIAKSRALQRVVAIVIKRLVDILECPNGTFWCIDPEDPETMHNVFSAPIKLDEDGINYRIHCRTMLERQDHRHKMRFDIYLLVNFEGVWNGEFIFSAPPNEKQFKISPDDSSQIDAYCQHVFAGMLAHLEGREDWKASGNPGMGFQAIISDRE